MNGTIIIQGAQYYMPIQLFVGNTEITDANCDDLKIKLNRTELKASTGDLVYGSYSLLGATYSGWLFPLTQAITLAMKAGKIPCQAQIQIGDAIIPTPITYIEVDATIIPEEW